MSARKNFAVDLGATFKVTVSVTDANGAVDLTGYKAVFKVIDNTLEVIRSTTDIASGNTFDVVIADDKTGSWPVSSRYTLDLEAPNGEVTRLMYGTLDARSGFRG